MNHKFSGIIVVCLLVLGCQKVHAQSDTPRFEVGAQFTVLHLKEFEFVPGRNRYGLGGRFSYNITDNVAVEAEGNYFHKGSGFDRRVTQGLFGAKVGARRKRVGVFGKARAGFLGLKDRLFCVIPEGCPTAPAEPQFDKRYALSFDLGGVVEFYPTRRISLRTDIGDTIVRFFQGTGVINGQPQRLYYTSHNIQLRTGVSFRF